MMKEAQLEELTCTGSNYEMGRIQGLDFRPRRQELFSKIVHNPFTPPWIRLGGVPLFKGLLRIKGWTMHLGDLANIQRYAPTQWERLKGIADGLGVDLSLMLGLSSIESWSASFQFVLGCTSLAIGPARSKTGAPLLGYNHDFPNFFKEHLFIRRSKPQEGFASIQLTYPLLPGSIAGVNSQGVAITLNHAFSMEPSNKGIHPTMLVQEALDHCRDANQVKEIFAQAKFACGSMVTVLDKKGTAYALELARSRFGVRKPTGDLSLTLNEYHLPQMKKIEVPQEAKFDPQKYPSFFHRLCIHSHNWGRRKRFEGLLKRAKRIGADDLKRYLSDHQGLKRGGLETICRHHPTTDTIATAVLYPQNCSMEVARGYACRAEYETFQI